MHTKTPLPRGANNYPHTHACIDIAFSTAQVPSPWHHQHVDQAAPTTDMLTCAALIVSTAAKHTKPHRKQAVSHPPTKTPQHSNKRFSQHCRTCERVVRASPQPGPPAPAGYLVVRAPLRSAPHSITNVEVHLVECQRSHPKLHKHRAQQSAMLK